MEIRKFLIRISRVAVGVEVGKAIQFMHIFVNSRIKGERGKSPGGNQPPLRIYVCTHKGAGSSFAQESLVV